MHMKTMTTLSIAALLTGLSVQAQGGCTWMAEDGQKDDSQTALAAKYDVSALTNEVSALRERVLVDSNVLRLACGN